MRDPRHRTPPGQGDAAKRLSADLNPRNSSASARRPISRAALGPEQAFRFADHRPGAHTTVEPLGAARLRAADSFASALARRISSFDPRFPALLTQRSLPATIPQTICAHLL
jgi:hypothetical protein